MGTKEDLLNDLTRRDSSGGIQRAHNALVGAGLKFKGPKNSSTLLYYFRSDGAEVGVAALRGSPSLISFPARFWSQHRASLNLALERFPSYLRPATEGLVSSSQFSAGQISITSESVETILTVINEVIISEARAAGA